MNIWIAWEDSMKHHYQTKKSFFEEGISNIDHAHSQKVWEVFEIKGLAWQACLKKTGVKLELVTDPNMLLMVEKGIRRRNLSRNT